MGSSQHKFESELLTDIIKFIDKEIKPDHNLIISKFASSAIFHINTAHQIVGNYRSFAYGLSVRSYYVVMCRNIVYLITIFLGETRTLCYTDVANPYLYDILLKNFIEFVEEMYGHKIRQVC